MAKMTENKPWLAHYDAVVPAHLDYPDHAIQGFLEQRALKDPDRVALICMDQKLTYRELVEKSQRFAAQVLDMGLKLGDRMGICLPNTIEFVIAYYGTLFAGGIVAAMNPGYPLNEWDHQTRIVHPKMIVGYYSRKTDLQELQRLHGVETLILIEDQITDEEKSAEGYCSYSKIFTSQPSQSHLPEILPDHPALLQFSGGTTGVPKAALTLHRSVVANIVQFKQWLTTLHDGEEVFLTLIPLYHVYGMVIGLNVGIAMGATIVLVPDGRDLETVLNLIQKHAVTFFPGVPSIYNAVNHHPKALAGQINLRTIKACISGSAPLLQETRTQFEALTGGKLVEGYGLSEAPTATHCNPLMGENRNGSIGLPLPDVDCRIVDLANADRQVPIGETGELLVRSPQLMQGYFNSPEETSIAMTDGWLHTGDLARMDQDGYYYIVGRRKELIKVNGLQVWPTEVEEVLMKYPGVKEAAVAGIFDEDTGEAVKAWLVMQQVEGFNLQEVANFCRTFLAGYKIPNEIEILTTLPKSPVGKILRRELIRMHNEKNKKPGA